MGLDASVGNFEEKDYISFRLGSYSGYAYWRRLIAKTQNFNLDDMEGFHGDIKWTNQPFQLVLRHSDCDGEYPISQIPELILEIKKIKELKIDNSDRCDNFLSLCKASLKQNLPIVFH